jgi:hypothetical protein
MTRKAADLRDGGPRCSCSPVLLGSLIGKCRGTSAAPSKAGDRLQDTNNGRPCRQKSRRGGNAVRRLTDCRASLALYSIWAGGAHVPFSAMCAARRSLAAWLRLLFPRVDGFTGQCYDFTYGNCSEVCSWDEWPERSGLAGYEPVPPYAAEA